MVWPACRKEFGSYLSLSSGFPQRRAWYTYISGLTTEGRVFSFFLWIIRHLTVEETNGNEPNEFRKKKGVDTANEWFVGWTKYGKCVRCDLRGYGAKVLFPPVVSFNLKREKNKTKFFGEIKRNKSHSAQSRVVFLCVKGGAEHWRENPHFSCSTRRA